jgi:RNA polymerase sigma factor (sigma-70 family)
MYSTGERSLKVMPDPRAWETSFDDFYSAQYPVIVRFLKARGASEEDARDITQESLIKLVRYQAQPAHVRKILLHRIALNGLSDLRRRNASRMGMAHVSVDGEAADLPCELPLPDRHVEQQQELARVRAAIARLPQRCRQVYLLNRVDGMSYSQIAEHCAISVKAVEKHISKALTSLRTDLADKAPRQPATTP